MDPDIGTSQNPDRVSDLLTPQRHRLAEDHIGFPDEETRGRLQYVLFAAIALFSMVVFFYSALCLSLHIQHFNFRPMIESTADEPAEPWTMSLSLSIHDQTVRSAFLKTLFDKVAEGLSHTCF